MNRVNWIFHPIVVFIYSILALAFSLFLYIYWYIEASSGLKALVRRFNLDSGQFKEPQAWVVILVLSLLVGVILLGIFTIFIYNQKTLQLYRLQRNFINNFTHELKTPVTSLRLFLETFDKYELPRRDQQKYIRFMLTDLSRLTDNITRILSLASLESKSWRGDFEDTDLHAAVARLLEENRTLFNGSDIRLHPAVGQPYRMQVDRTLFNMLVMNLLTNAVKYNEAAPPTVDIRFHYQKLHLQIRFEDNGIGLPPGELKKIFKRFYRSTRNAKQMPAGSGLGLNLVQNIARIHRGRVTAVNRNDARGAVFTLTLPTKWLQTIRPKK